MAKYTMTINELVRYYQGSNRDLSYRDKITAAAQQIIDFPYPIYGSTAEEQTAFRTQLNSDICRHYLMREIGYETYELWKIMLEERLTLIMPRYQQLYNTTLFNLDIHNPYHLVTTHTEKDDINTNGKRYSTDDITTQNTQNETLKSTDTGTSTNTESTTNNSTVTATTNSKVVDDESTTSTKNSDIYHSDFPQVQISLDYASSEDKGNEDITSNRDGTQTTTGNTSQTTKGDGTLDSTSNNTNSREGSTDITSNGTDNHVFNGTESEIRNRINDYVHDIKGHTDNMEILTAVEKWRDLIININERIIDELTDLFMLVF